jgi:hypothetical protein
MHTKGGCPKFTEIGCSRTSLTAFGPRPWAKPTHSEDISDMMGRVMTRAVNRDPKRWVDESGRVRVIEGWHPSQPTRLGYNVLVDDDWVGTFDTLDGAADAATSSARFRHLPLEEGQVVLSRVPGHGRTKGRAGEIGLRVVSDADAEPER